MAGGTDRIANRLSFHVLLIDWNPHFAAALYLPE